MTEKLIIVRGGGDIATGTVHRLYSAGFPVLVLETERPAAIRRQVSVSEAVYDGEACVEGMRAVRIESISEVQDVIGKGCVPVLVDKVAESVGILHPEVVVDAILAKKNTGTKKDMAPLTIGLGPGFEAGADVDIVIETMRGHDLGRVIYKGFALANTGVPAKIKGFGKERVIYAKKAGTFRGIKKIGDIVNAGDVVARIEREDGEKIEVYTEISGILRGLLKDGYPVREHFKVADVDPRMEELGNCFTISDKARCIGGSVLEAVAAHFNGFL